MRVKHITHADSVATFCIVAEGLLQWLQQMHAEAPLESLACQCDHTFNLEWQGYTFGSFGVVVQRKLAGTWRRSYVPLLWTCTPF